MNDRWHKSLQAAVAAYDTPMPWDRGTQSKELIARRKSEKKIEIRRHVIRTENRVSSRGK
ncbi:hypothetical protein [Yoonia sediminilitoris]|uniref:Uncharacterized protein n=1 Tax=Yoonia sediminilitoris TaxID=1286148 RepID=A0A2T6KQC2_9RHOB|nr:hypothetical protein [Yoonia sediminilitoris]PUB18756.1 hypothetical protein C8N45_101342 [Yoonia sediminilitoris]RCW98924.1 hypothetical protein DFP92_101342 [Yoonia sediminilitoris]